MSLKIGVSGKRLIAANEAPMVAREIELHIKKILSREHKIHFVGYTGLATGADTLFAEVVTQVFKQPLRIVLPFEAEEFEKDFEDPGDLDRLRKLLHCHKKIDVLSDQIPATPGERNRAYFEQGCHIVDSCNEMVFVWDGLKARGHGGTAEIIGYYSEKWNKTDIPYICVSAEEEDLLQNKLISEYNLANNQAIRSRNAFKNIWRAAIYMGWLAVILFAFKVGYHLKERQEILVVSLEFLLVISVFLLFIRAKKKDYHGSYLKKRIRAETFRILQYFYHANIEVKISSVTMDKHPSLSAVVDKINEAVLKWPYRSTWYSNYSIRKLIEEQKEYHAGRVKSIGNKPRIFETINIGVGVFFLVNLCLHCANTISTYWHLTTPFYSEEFAVFASIALPATYAAIEGTLFYQGWMILKRYSEFAEKSLRESSAALPCDLTDANDSSCFEKQIQALSLVSKIMLTDNMSWQLLLEDKDNYNLIL